MSVLLRSKLVNILIPGKISRQSFMNFKFFKPKNSQNISRTYSSHQLPMDKMLLVKEDVLLYTLEKTSFIKCVTVFGLGQFVICTFLGCNMFFSLKDLSKTQEISDSKRLNLGDFKYKLFASLGCFAVGIIAATFSYYLPTRIVKHVTLCKGGQLVTILTYGPFGKVTKFTVPLQNLSCMIARKDASSYLPLKVKKKWFFYLIDSNGQFHNPALFDISVGTRSW